MAVHEPLHGSLGCKRPRPAPMRDILLQLAVTDIFRAKWTADIHREWMEALLRNEPHRERAAVQRTRDLMDRATRDCLISDYEELIPSLELPDPDDRHVLAAAIVGRCNMIVTQNLKDFPQRAVAKYGIETNHPEDFLCRRLNLSPGIFCAAIRKVRARLMSPPFSAEEYRAVLARQGLVATASELDQYADLI